MSEKILNTEELIGAFNLKGELKGVEKINDGHINNTYRFNFIGEDGRPASYLIQELNTSVFRQPVELMNNIVGVTSFLRERVIKNGGDPDRESLFVFRANDGKPYYIDSEGGFWRCFNFVDGTHSVSQVTGPEVFRLAARAFGRFQNMLADYPMDELAETIPNFHNTASRFADFEKALADNLSGRADNCRAEAEFILARKNDCGVLTGLIASGDLPLRVTHNDTKLNNVLFDNETGEGICIVDLDTVMSGLSLYDFGDSIRFGASTAAEDEKDLDKVHFSMEYFRAYAEGYLAEAGGSLTPNEIRNLAFASKIMTLECGMRFLGDYINGDTYFKTAYPEHNLVRARTQLKLVAEMEEAMPQMEKAIEEICAAGGIAI